MCNEIQTILGAKPPKANIANNIKKWYHIVHKQYPPPPAPPPLKRKLVDGYSKWKSK